MTKYGNSISNYHTITVMKFAVKLFCNAQRNCLFQENFVQVIQNQEYLLLPSDEVCRLLASDDLNVPDEETIFHALMMWTKHDNTNRKKCLARLLSHIKLPLMSPQVKLHLISPLVNIGFWCLATFSIIFQLYRG
jgi:hypothetical protein